MSATRTVSAMPGDTMTLTSASGQGRDRIEAGKSVRVTGFDLTAYGRIHNFGRRPGIYLNPSWCQVEGPAGQRATVSIAYLDAPAGREPHQVDPESLRLRDLPDTRFWETDVVRGPGGERLEVVGVDHLLVNGGRYTCSVPDGGTRELREAEMALVERGPVWRRAHGEKPAFPDAEAHAAFLRLVGEVDQVRNPDRPTYAFDRDEAVAALESGLAHGFYDGSEPFTGSDQLITYRDAAAGEAMRVATLDWIAQMHSGYPALAV